MEAAKAAPVQSIADLASRIQGMLATAQHQLLPGNCASTINIDVARAMVIEAGKLAAEIVARSSK